MGTYSVSRFWDRLSLATTAFLVLCFFWGLLGLAGCEVRPSPNPSDEVFCIDGEDGHTYCCREFATSETDCWTE